MSRGGEWVALDFPAPAPGEMHPFALAGLDLLLCNVAGELYAIDSSCPHAGAALADGTLRGCILECPLHGGKLDVRSGAPTAPPIRRRVGCYEVRRERDQVFLLLP